MKVILIGAGNVATSLGHALFHAGHDIVQVYSRTMESASTLATQIGGAPVTDLSALSSLADVYIFAVKDSVLAELIPTVCKGRESKLFIHTAGSVPVSVFSGMARSYGVIYPMQSFSRSNVVDFAHVPCFIEANDMQTLAAIRELAMTITDNVHELPSDDRRYLHLAAVFACNFTNLCYTVAADILEKHDLPFEVMLPLIDQTAAKVHAMHPADAQTGPAVRYDNNVIRNQANMLSDNIIYRDLYMRLSAAINQIAKKRNHD
jgi:predicted short-subunit dehydrogenase-like oxidoreductase (DUF2520 family)